MNKTTNRKREIAAATPDEVLSRLFALAQVDERDFLQTPDCKLSLAESAAYLDSRLQFAATLMRKGRETYIDGKWVAMKHRADTLKKAAEFARLVDAKRAANPKMDTATAKRCVMNELGIKRRTMDRRWSDAGRATKRTAKKPAK